MSYEPEKKEYKPVVYNWSKVDLDYAWSEYQNIKEQDYTLRRLLWLKGRNAVNILNMTKKEYAVIPENYKPMSDLFDKMENKFGKRKTSQSEAESLEHSSH